MPVTRSRTDFLSNSDNKKRFVEALVLYLLEKGISAKQSTYNDADEEVVQTAVDLSKSKPTVCVGKDSDLLVLLLSKEGNEYNFLLDSLRIIAMHMLVIC